MYLNRISRPAPKRTSSSHPQFSIPLSNFAVDPRLAYVESVCRTLIESRFGPDFIFEPFCTSPRRCTSPRVSKGDMSIADAPEKRGRSTPFLDWADLSVPPLLTRGLVHLGRDTQAGCLRSDEISGTHDATGGDASVNERALQFWDARSSLSSSAFLGRGSP